MLSSALTQRTTQYGFNINTHVKITLANYTNHNSINRHYTSNTYTVDIFAHLLPKITHTHTHTNKSLLVPSRIFVMHIL